MIILGSLVLIELFSLAVTAEALRWANIDSKSAISLQRGPVHPKFQVEGVAPTNHSSSQKTRLNDLSYDIKIWTDFSSVLSQSTLLTEGQTDGQNLSPCIQCRAMKTGYSMIFQDNVVIFCVLTTRYLSSYFRVTYKVISVVLRPNRCAPVPNILTPMPAAF